MMKRYYAQVPFLPIQLNLHCPFQLLLLSNQFPLDGKHPDLAFEWQWYVDQYTVSPIPLNRRSDRLHDPNNVLILADVQFELCNLLYNLACIHAQIGSELPRDTDEVYIEIRLFDRIYITVTVRDKQ